MRLYLQNKILIKKIKEHVLEKLNEHFDQLHNKLDDEAKEQLKYKQNHWIYDTKQIDDDKKEITVRASFNDKSKDKKISIDLKITDEQIFQETSDIRAKWEKGQKIVEHYPKEYEVVKAEKNLRQKVLRMLKDQLRILKYMKDYPNDLNLKEDGNDKFITFTYNNEKYNLKIDKKHLSKIKNNNHEALKEIANSMFTEYKEFIDTSKWKDFSIEKNENKLFIIIHRDCPHRFPVNDKQHIAEINAAHEKLQAAQDALKPWSEHFDAACKEARAAQEDFEKQCKKLFSQSSGLSDCKFRIKEHQGNLTVFLEYSNGKSFDKQSSQVEVKDEQTIKEIKSAHEKLEQAIKQVDQAREGNSQVEQQNKKSLARKLKKLISRLKERK